MLRETASLVAQALKRSGSILLPAHGCSMYPAIREGELRRFIPWQVDELRKGEILLFCSETDGALVAHRFHRTMTSDGGVKLLCKGDSNLGFDAPIRLEQVVAVMAPDHKNWWGRLGARLWARVMVWNPWVSYFLHHYAYRVRNRRSTKVTP